MSFCIETERLILREIQDTDLEGMFALDSDPEVHKYLPGTLVTTREESQKIIDSIRRQYEERRIGRWAVVHKQTNEFMGWSGLKLNTEEPMNGFENFYDIGYRFIPRYWGNGYATESGKASIVYAFENMKLDTVYGITILENQASHNVLLKIGLSFVEDFYYDKENLRLRWYEITNT